MGNSKYYKELNALAVVDRSVKVQLRQDKRQLYCLCLYANPTGICVPITITLHYMVI